MTRRSRAHPGFTLLELAISLALVTVLLAVLLPALAAARVTGARQECASNLRRLGPAWHMYIEDHDGRFPFVPVQTGWHYGGVRFSGVDGTPFLDHNRPLAPYTPGGSDHGAQERLFECPADDGIGNASGVGTGDRTAYESFGTSYRANARLLDARRSGFNDARRGLRRGEIATSGSRLFIMGDATWYELRHGTSRNAHWHDDEDKCNLLFLDGAVKYMEVWKKPRIGPAVFEPMLVEDTGIVTPARPTD